MYVCACIVVTRVCVSVCPRPHAYTIAQTRTQLGGVVGDAPVCTIGADLQSVHGLCCYGNTRNAWQSPAVICQAHRTLHALRMPAKTPLASANTDTPAACAVPFRPYCGGVVTRTRNGSEYMLVEDVTHLHNF